MQEVESPAGGAPQHADLARVVLPLEVSRPLEANRADQMAAPERLELPTVSFEGCRSIQLSYGAARSHN